MNLEDASEAEKEILFTMLFKYPESVKPNVHLFENLKPHPGELFNININSASVDTTFGGPEPSSARDPRQPDFDQGNTRHNNQTHNFGANSIQALQNGPHVPVSSQAQQTGKNHIRQ
jgi:hypothetical protein